MSLQYLPGTKLFIFSYDAKLLGEVVVDKYMESERKYKVWWIYKQTGERELIEVPEWRLLRKSNALVGKICSIGD